MKTFSFPTCKGLLKIAAPSRDEAIRILKILAWKNRRAQYVPVGKERMKRYRKIIYG